MSFMKRVSDLYYRPYGPQILRFGYQRQCGSCLIQFRSKKYRDRFACFLCHCWYHHNCDDRFIHANTVVEGPCTSCTNGDL